MSASAILLRSLDAISHETVTMVDVLESVTGLPEHERREAKRRMLQIRGLAQELSQWASEVRVEEPRN